ncbi:hypothetical protein [Pseudoxanthomonas putridarboris]
MPRPTTEPDTHRDADGSAVPPALATFALYSMHSPETAASIAARRALMSRKGLSVEEANQRAQARRRQAGRIGRFNATAVLLSLAALMGTALAWMGSTRESQSWLLIGYGVVGIVCIAALACLTRVPAAARQPLEHYYLPDEQLATAEDIVLLRRLAGDDPELEAITSTWWRSPAPIRKADLRLALDLQRAKSGSVNRAGNRR